MKKLFLLMVIVAMTGTAAMAQETKDKLATDPKATAEQKEVKKQDMKAMHAEWDKKLKDELKLTPEQTAKYDALNKEYNEKIDVVLQDASLNKDSQKEKKMALKKEKETKLLEFLTPEQQTSYKNLIEKKNKEMAVKPAGS